MQSASSDWGTRPSTPTGTPQSWGNPPQSATAANKNSSGGYSTFTGTVAKPASSKPVTAKTDKSDDTLVKASYTETKSANDKSSGSSKSTKPVASKYSAEKTASEAETVESPPINLGILRLLNSKRIVIRYELKDPASIGVDDLEVWGTTDLRSWKKYDAAKQSPSSLVVNVAGEGMYGFTVQVRAKGDSTKNLPPQAEPPQMWVAVDMTKPVVLLLGAEMNAMEQMPSLIVRWNAKDRNLGPRPITLLYAERPEGPWAPIAANLENTGHYEWIMPPCVPANVCVRVLATDLMGNVGMVQTATLRIPGRSENSTHLTEQTLAPPPSTSTASTPSYQPAIHPIAARAPRPTTTILSVNGD
jgi:hypothetical protein